MRRRDFLLTPALLLLACSTDDEPAVDTSDSGVPETPGEWQQRSPLPTPRSEVASAVLDGRIFVLGGYLSQGSASDTNEAYDPASDRWERLAPMPAARDHPMAAALNGRLYVFGGNSGNEARSVFAYDAGAARWTTLRDMPVRRAAGGTAVLEGRIVLAGGTGDRPETTWIYDPQRDTWTEGPPLPSPREHLAVTATDSAVYVVGGRWDNQLKDTNEALSSLEGTWQTLAPMPTARGGTSAGALGGKIYVAGGEAFSPSRTFPQVEVYDPASNAWAAVPDLPTPRHGLAVQGYDGRLFVIGGGPTAGLSVDPRNEALVPL